MGFYLAISPLGIFAVGCPREHHFVHGSPFQMMPNGTIIANSLTIVNTLDGIIALKMPLLTEVSMTGGG